MDADGRRQRRLMLVASLPYSGAQTVFFVWLPPPIMRAEPPAAPPPLVLPRIRVAPPELAAYAEPCA
jgi:hypothetical protein